MSEQQKIEEALYLENPFPADESLLTCVTTKIRTARKRHVCYGLDGKQDHYIEKGDRYRYERALVDRSFWGEYRVCLNCMDAHLAGDI